MSVPKVHILTRGEEESWNSFSRRIRDAEGEAIVILSTADNNFLLEESERKLFLGEIAKLRYRVKLATKEPAVIAAARKLSIKVFQKTRTLRKALVGHPKSADALRFFSPSLWRQQWRSRLQAIGLLSMPKLRIWALIVLSSILFLFVVFRLLPSAEVRVWPRKDVVSQTMNIVLVASGTVAKFPEHVRIMPLVPIRVVVSKAVTFQDISPEFIGQDAQVTMTVINRTDEAVSLKSGTRLMNQAGMIFRLEKGITITGSGTQTVRAKADHEDIYGKIIGDRGNVPPGVRWELPGLPEQDRKLIYAENRSSATGGRTAYRTVLQQKDLELARKRLEQELLAEAKKQVELERKSRNLTDQSQNLEFLLKNGLIRRTYSGVTLPTGLLGKQVEQVVAEGSLIYIVPAYDTTGIIARFGGDLRAHLSDGKTLLEDTLHMDPARVELIEYADNFSWIKITADIVATEQYVLDPLTPTGAKFGKKVRAQIVGLGSTDALRIIRNLPEVDRVEIGVWPPWGRSLPSIPSNISIEPQ